LQRFWHGISNSYGPCLSAGAFSQTLRKHRSRPLKFLFADLSWIELRIGCISARGHFLSVPKANPSASSGYVVPQELHLFELPGRSRVRSVTPSRRIEDRIRKLSRKLIEAEENTNEFKTISAELRFAIFTLEWQIRTRLKNFPAEVDRRSSR
jgi:hypothetical protein